MADKKQENERVSDTRYKDSNQILYNKANQLIPCVKNSESVFRNNSAVVTCENVSGGEQCTAESPTPCRSHSQAGYV